MTYAIVYSSQTGNTALLAEQIKKVLPEKNLLYYGAPHNLAEKADFIFVGFWTDKGSCDQEVSEFLKTLHDKKVFLFGTAGFGGSEAYFDQILSRVEANLDSSNTVAGHYMCQGKMPLSVRQRYQSMEAVQPDKMKELIENFDRALAHPNQTDLENFIQTALKYIEKIGERE